jgi:hypothetical protein
LSAGHVNNDRSLQIDCVGLSTHVVDFVEHRSARTPELSEQHGKTTTKREKQIMRGDDRKKIVAVQYCSINWFQGFIGVIVAYPMLTGNNGFAAKIVSFRHRENGG